MKHLLSVILALFLLNSYAQEVQTLELIHSNGQKGDFYISWGYNRAFYNNSDIHFAGEGYSFTLNDVRAADVPEEFDPQVYFNIRKLTIPQFNFRVGYSLNDKWTVTGGWDHMKYKILQDQVVDIDGFINHSVSEEYGGVYSDRQQIALSRDFLRYEHSDGFNYLRFGLEYRMHAWHSDNNKLRFDIFPGINAGAMLPWTDYTIFNTRYKNFPHLSGYGMSVTMASRLEFFKHFFFQVQAQYGYTNLTDVNLEDKGPARGKQSIVFFERSFAFGAYIHTFRR